jgi:hypothetical protein
MAALTIQDASAGANVTLGAATGGGDTVAGGSRAAGWDLGVYLLVLNGGAGAITVSIDGVAQTALPNTAGSNLAVYPLYAGQFGKVRAITYSGVTSVTVAAVRTTPAP